LGSVYTWSYAYHLVRIYASKFCNEAKIAENSMENPMSITKTDPEKPSTCSTGSPFVSVVGDKSQSQDHFENFEIYCTNSDHEKTEETQKGEMMMEQVKTLVKKMKLKILFTPSTIGTIVGLIIGIVPQFRRLLIGDKAPLHVVQDSIMMVGYACIPVMTLLVGANLIKGLNGLGKQFALVVGISVMRCIVLPGIGVGIIKGAIRLGFIHHDPLYQFLLLLQFAVPPAVALSTITQLFGAGESECSVIMFATYSC
ncbi:protein PIN-LIKES 3-like, partial [Vigna radiata var. radiata]|uniref:Protein PIN-LIKES 3-like n=1 Tax=Vigna radiata var. radiata TaxID=3916 RepID=A0A1S3T8V2_VIGRR